MWVPIIGPVELVQFDTVPEIFQVNVPVGAGRSAEPVTTAEKINVWPTVVDGGEALTKIVGVDVPRFTVTTDEVADK